MCVKYFFLNKKANESAIFSFCEIYDLANITKDKLCFTNPNEPTCIDSVITNRRKFFWNIMFFRFRKMSVTVINKTVVK